MQSVIQCQLKRSSTFHLSTEKNENELLPSKTSPARPADLVQCTG